MQWLLYYQKTIKNFRYIFLFLAFTTTLHLQAQDKIPCGKKWYIKPAFNYGFVMQHRASMGHLIKSYVPMVEMNLVKASDGCKLWQLENNLPEWGITATFMDFSNPKILGNSYSISPYLEIPLNKKVRFTRPIFRISWGLAYVTKRFDRVNNNKNIAIGSHWNAFVQYRFLWHIDLNKKLRLEPGIGISHVSNGRFQVPNLGLNLVTANLGLTYKLNNPTCEKTVIDSSTKVKSRHEALVWGAFGMNDNDPPGNAKMNAYTLSFNYFYNVRNTSKLGGGLDVYYEESYLKELDMHNKAYPNALDMLRIGIKFCYAYNVGRLSLPIEMGFYAHYLYNDNGPIFHRFGIRYNAKNGLMFQFALKSHWAVAYHFDLGIGYTFALKKKQYVKG